MQGNKIRSEVRSEIAEVKTEGSYLCNLTSDLRNGYVSALFTWVTIGP
jgi:hypothetical protein